MTTAAQPIIRDAQVNLQDVAGTRWPASELIGHLNDEQREILRIRPDLKAAPLEMDLSAGGHQFQLPADAMVLIAVRRNLQGTQRAITQTDLAQLDAVVPDWRSMTPVTTVIHWMADSRNPRTFYVYPPVPESGGVS